MWKYSKFQSDLGIFVWKKIHLGIGGSVEEETQSNTLI